MLSGFVTIAVLFFCAVGFGSEPKVYNFTITKKGILPKKITVAANQEIKFIVKNETNGGEEFEIISLDMEIGVQASKTETFKLGPLKPGTYKFSGHELPGGEFVAK